MKNSEPIDKMIQKCDQVSIFGYCMLVHFLPISSALLQWSFAFIFLPFLLKNIFKSSLIQSEEKADKKSLRAFHSIRSFFSGFVPKAFPLKRQLVFFVLWAFVSVFFSIDFSMSLKGFIYNLLQGVLICLICVDVIKTQKRLIAVLSVMMFNLIIISTNGLYQLNNGVGFIRHFQSLEGRVASTFSHPNDFAGYLILFIPVLIGFSIFFKYDIKQPHLEDAGIRFVKNAYFRIIATIILITALACLGYTFSRSAWGALIVLLFNLLLLSRKNMLYLVVIGAVFFIIFYPKLQAVRDVSFVSDSVQSDLSKDKTLQDKLLRFRGMGRKTFWNEAVNVIKHHPLTGSGLKTYRKAGEIYNPKWTGYHAHNCYLQLWAETGLIGLISFIWLLLGTVKYTLNNLKEYSQSGYFFLVSAFFAGFIAFLFQSAFDTNLYTTKLYTLFWLILGLILAIQVNFITGRVEKSG